MGHNLLSRAYENMYSNFHCLNNQETIWNSSCIYSVNFNPNFLKLWGVVNNNSVYYYTTMLSKYEYPLLHCFGKILLILTCRIRSLIYFALLHLVCKTWMNPMYTGSITINRKDSIRAQPQQLRKLICIWIGKSFWIQCLVYPKIDEARLRY